jgi:hypothetical protein
MRDGTKKSAVQRQTVEHNKSTIQGLRYRASPPTCSNVPISTHSPKEDFLEDFSTSGADSYPSIRRRRQCLGRHCSLSGASSLVLSSAPWSCKRAQQKDEAHALVLSITSAIPSAGEAAVPIMSGTCFCAYIKCSESIIESSLSSGTRAFQTREDGGSAGTVTRQQQ